MLAATPESLDDLRFPLVASRKLDGVRCITTGNGVISRTFKPFPNNKLQEKFGGLPANLDGELIAGPWNADDVLRRTVSTVMTEQACVEDVTFYVFDCVDRPNIPFGERHLYDMNIGRLGYKDVVVHDQTYIDTRNNLDEYASRCFDEGFEGVITRDPKAPYKFGRSTMREQGMVKIKRWRDAEAEIIGWEPLQHNQNVATTNALGHTERSSHKAGKVASDELVGKLHCRTKEGVEFSIGGGPGLTMDLRREFYQFSDKLIGKFVKYSYIPYGEKDKPRNPKFLGIRHPMDM